MGLVEVGMEEDSKVASGSVLAVTHTNVGVGPWLGSCGVDCTIPATEVSQVPSGALVPSIPVAVEI
jgi:hypothetical protein